MGLWVHPRIVYPMCILEACLSVVDQDINQHVTPHEHHTHHDLCRYRFRYDLLVGHNTPGIDHQVNMTAAEGVTIGAAAIRRRELTGKTGMSALMENKRALFIAVFASFGGLLYGYQQGVLGEFLPSH